MMMIMSLRDGNLPSKQSPVSRGDCLEPSAGNDMLPRSNALLLAVFGDFVRELQSTSGMIT